MAAIYICCEFGQNSHQYFDIWSKIRGNQIKVIKQAHAIKQDKGEEENTHTNINRMILRQP